MDEQRQAIIAGATRLAAELPPPTVHALAQLLERAGAPLSPTALRGQALQVAPQPAQRAHMLAFLDEWLERAPSLSSSTWRMSAPWKRAGKGSTRSACPRPFGRWMRPAATRMACPFHVTVW